MTDRNTVAEIRAYAAANGIDLPSGGRKAELLAAIHKEMD